jgi:integrase
VEAHCHARGDAQRRHARSAHRDDLEGAGGEGAAEPLPIRSRPRDDAGVKRTRGIAQREAKPLLREDLFRVLDTMGEGVKDARDRALLLTGFAGGLRRSQIIGLGCEDIDHVRQGLIVTLKRSKTDPGRMQASRPSRSGRRQPHATDVMLGRYVPEGEPFVDNAAGALL